MEVKIIQFPSDQDWLKVKNNALATMGKESEKIPDSVWRIKILASEHSPIRDLIYTWEWQDLPSWVSVHFVRHKIGIEHFVKSQRNDRQSDYDRRKAPQDSPVNHRCTANAQAIINISLKRLCLCASPETREAWQKFLFAIKPLSPELFSLCVPSCVYRNGICPEVFSLGKLTKTEAFRKNLEQYQLLFSK